MSAIVLFRGRGLISALIRWQTRGDYAHAALLMDDGKLIESWQGVGVRIKSDPDLSDATIFDVPSMTQAQWDRALFFARCQVGKGYDYWAIIRFITRERMPDNDRYFCSELVFDSIEHAGVNLLARIKGWAVDPSRLELSPLMVERRPL